MLEKTWIKVKDIAPLMNMTYGSIRYAIHKGTFPIHTMRLGRDLVCDAEAVRRYFEDFREASLEKLDEFLKK